MKHIKTSSGFELETEESVFDDYEVFEALLQLEKKDATVIPFILERILGADKTRLIEHLRNEKGITPITAMVAEIKEIVAEAAKK